jgi:hypothetical protein
MPVGRSRPGHLLHSLGVFQGGDDEQLTCCLLRRTRMWRSRRCVMSLLAVLQLTGCATSRYVRVGTGDERGAAQAPSLRARADQVIE